MKKVTALFFVTLFFFNLFGYRWVYDFLQQKASVQLEASLDKNLYSDAQLTELKVALNLPYQTNWAGYQRCDGEIEIGGVAYKYVKRKVANDTLYLLCIPNTKKMHLETAKNDFFKYANDLSQNNSSKKSGDSKISFKIRPGEYDEYSFFLKAGSVPAHSSHLWHSSNANELLSSPRPSPEQPPDGTVA